MKPLHRSPVLWLSLFGGFFIMWAWHDSHRYSSRGQTYLMGRSISLGHYDGRVSVALTDGPIASVHTRVSRDPAGPPSDSPPFLFVGSYTNREIRWGPLFGTARHLVIPHWLILLPHLALCAIVLVWRKRRYARAATPK